MLQDCASRLALLSEQFENLQKILQIENYLKRREELKLAMSDANFFKRPEAENMLAELKETTTLIEEFES